MGPLLLTGAGPGAKAARQCSRVERVCGKKRLIWRCAADRKMGSHWGPGL